MIIATFGGVEIPAVSVVDASIEVLGDRGRTAGGKLRQDVYGDTPTKRTWKIKTGKITRAQADLLLNHLNASVYEADDFWLDIFGEPSNTVKAFVTVDGIKRTRLAIALGGTATE